MKLISIVLSLSLISSLSFGVVAFPGELTFTQNSGETFKGRLKGDEWLNYVSLPNDYVALYNKEKKSYEYALIKVVDGKKVLRPSGQLVSEKLHLENPKNLAKTIPPLDITTLSTLYRPSKTDRLVNKRNQNDENRSHYKHKVLKTKSTQWKEVLKQKDPSKTDGSKEE